MSNDYVPPTWLPKPIAYNNIEPASHGRGTNSEFM